MRYNRDRVVNFDLHGWRFERTNIFGGHAVYGALPGGGYEFEQDATNRFKATCRSYMYV